MNNTTYIIKKASDELGFESKFLDDNNCLLRVYFKNSSQTNQTTNQTANQLLSHDFKTHLFVANNSGLNDEVVRKICNDKFYTFLLLKNDVTLPDTNSFVDPRADDIYEGYSGHDSNQEIIGKILEKHEFPVVIKANSLSRGINVFKCEDEEQVSKAVANIFNKNSKNYDHVLISQDHLEIKKEYRVLVYNQEIMFVYQKDNVSVVNANNFVGNLSPLHWENSKAVLLEDQELKNELKEFINPIYGKLNLKYGGLDVARDNNGGLQLIEINTQPGFSYFIRDNSDVEVQKMYIRILKDLNSRSTTN